MMRNVDSIPCTVHPIFFLLNISQGPGKATMGETKFTRKKKDFGDEIKLFI